MPFYWTRLNSATEFANKTAATLGGRRFPSPQTTHPLRRRFWNRGSRPGVRGKMAALWYPKRGSTKLRKTATSTKRSDKPGSFRSNAVEVVGFGVKQPSMEWQRPAVHQLMWATAKVRTTWSLHLFLESLSVLIGTGEQFT